MKYVFLAPLAAALALSPAPVSAQSFTPSVDFPDSAFSEKRTRAIAAVQILLARSGHSPGVIDGYPGGNTTRALEAAGLGSAAPQEALAQLREKLGDAPVFKDYTITSGDVSGGFTRPGDGMQEQAENGNVGYGSASEMLAEKFGMSEAFLKALNPGSGFQEGDEIKVANMARPPLEGVSRILVDGGAKELRVYDGSDNLLASFPATVGSGEFPSPSGTMEVNAVAPNAAYYFDPSDQDWGGDERLEIPAGPNNPVGGIWIDLSKDGYGIHGSPDPNLIGKTSSHGCVRLTNWDAEYLASAVESGVTVEFV